MGKTTIEVFHDNNPAATYMPGQLMRGLVVIHNAEKLDIRGVRVEFIGKATVRWSEGSGKNRRTYWNSEKYYHATCVVYGHPSSSSERVELGVGDHSFPFQFQLPPDIPASFQGAWGRVVHGLLITVDKPWAFDVTLELPFFVARGLDLNQLPDALSETTRTNEKFICCWCCKSGPLSASVRVPRKGYVGGEVIRVFSEMQNLSSRQIKQCYVALIMATEFHATSKTRTTHEELCRVQGPAIPEGGSHHFHGETLTVPPVVIPSFLQGCNIIDIHYYVTAVMDPAGPAFDLGAPAEVVLGTVPHAMAQGVEMGVSDAPRPFGTTDVPAQPLPGLSPGFAQQQYGMTQQPGNAQQPGNTQQYGMTQQYGGMDFGGDGSNKYGSAFDY